MTAGHNALRGSGPGRQHAFDDPRDLVGERDSRNLRRPPRQQGREPWAMLGAMDLGVADNGERTGHKQAARKLKALSFVIAMAKRCGST